MARVSSPLVSVITPAYNAGSFIGETIKSVARQSFQDWELIVIDDCSSDDTAQIVQSWSDSDRRITLLRNEENLGPGPSRNRGVNFSKGRYVAYLDSDDLWKPEKLERQVAYIEDVRAPMVFSSYEIIDSGGNAIGKTIAAPARVTYSDLLKNTVIGCLTVIVDRNKVANPFMPSIPSRQPLVLWLQILREHGDAFGLPETLASYRVRPGSVSSNKIDAAKSVWKVYREYERLRFGSSCFYFSCYAWNSLGRNIGSITLRV